MAAINKAPGVINSNAILHASKIVSKGLFKLQIAYKTNIKSTTTIPTQLLKLAFSNQFGNDVTTSAKIKELYKDYVKNFSDIQKEQFSKLYDSLGITINTNGDISNVNYKIPNI